MQNERKFDDFDSFANDYREIHSENVKISGADSDYFCKHKVDTISKWSKSRTIEHILDLGCGDGAVLKHLAGAFPASDCQGIDVSAESIQTAKDNLGDTATCQVYDGLNIPYEENTFDLAVIAMVLHHVSEELHENLLKDLHRVLKPGGRVFIFEHNPYNPVTRHIVNTCPFDEDAVLINAGKCKRTLKKVGFKIDRNDYTLFFPRGKLFQWLHPLEDHVLHSIPFGAQYYVVASK